MSEFVSDHDLEETETVSLRDLIDEAIAQLERFRHPNVDQVQGRLNEILKAAGKGGITHDRIERLVFRPESLHIQTSYSVRSCEQTAEFEIPFSVLDADDPVAAARQWGRQDKIKEAEDAVKEARRALAVAEEELREILAEIG
jgi:hypothetical protein